jgi:hypothetical protein
VPRTSLLHAGSPRAPSHRLAVASRLRVQGGTPSRTLAVRTLAMAAKAKGGKVKFIHLCEDCGEDFPQWHGKCPNCGEWNTYAARPAACYASRSCNPLVACVMMCGSSVAETGKGK